MQVKALRYVCGPTHSCFAFAKPIRSTNRGNSFHACRSGSQMRSLVGSAWFAANVSRTRLTSARDECLIGLQYCRSTVRALFSPLADAAVAAISPSKGSEPRAGNQAPDGVDPVAAALMTVYQDSDAHAGLYNYAKALEATEAGLLDYFYQHFRLAGVR